MTAAVVGAIALSQQPTTVELVGIALVVAGIATRDRRGDHRSAGLELEASP